MELSYTSLIVGDFTLPALMRVPRLFVSILEAFMPNSQSARERMRKDCTK